MTDPFVVLLLNAMTDAATNNPTPQFATAEYVGKPGNDHCQFCHQPITGNYYRVNDAMACIGCGEKMKAELSKDTHAAYTRGLLFGLGGAILGMILYAAFAITTGIIIGYTSLAVGWMVGKAILKGSNGVGGRRYQITAALLTYAAVSMAAIPVWIHYASTQKQAQQQQVETEQRQLESEFGQSHTPVPKPTIARPSLGSVLLKLALLGIASPLLEIWETGPTVGWMIGVVILAVGIRIAWRITAAPVLQVYGPF